MIRKYKLPGNQKYRCIFWSVILLVSLIPVFMIAPFDAAAGDDYGFGAGAHLAYLETGSLWEALKGAAQTTFSTWHSWQGTWFDCFVFALHPEVFSDSAYVIVPFIFVLMQIGAFILLSHHFLYVRWRICNAGSKSDLQDNLFWLEVALIFLIFNFQLLPSQKSGIFWWVGCVHYVMPMCLAIIGMVFGDNFLLKHRIRDIIGLSVIAAIMGGSTYPAAILLFLALFLLWLSDFVISGKRDRRNFWMLIPLALELMGLYISAIAPGNAIRSASDIEDGATPSGGILTTIVDSITFSVTDAITYFIADKTFVLIALILIGIISYGALTAYKNNMPDEFEHIFSHPLLFTATLFLLNAAIYAPRIYAGNHVSSGYHNFNFQVFFICAIAIEIYLLAFLILRGGYVHSKAQEHKESRCDNLCNVGSNQQVSAGLPGLNKSKSKSIKKHFICMLILFVVCFIAFLGRHGVKRYTDYVCLEYYLSGQASDYREQIKLQRLLMSEEGVDDVVVPQINNEQGPLMHMPIVADPHNVDNTMTSAFYGKNSCRSIDRNEWIELYGAKYGIE